MLLSRCVEAETHRCVCFGDVRDFPASRPAERVSTRLVFWRVVWPRRVDTLLYCGVVVCVCYISLECVSAVSMCAWLPRSAGPLHCDAEAQKHTQTPRCVTESVRDTYEHRRTPQSAEFSICCRQGLFLQLMVLKTSHGLIAFVYLQCPVNICVHGAQNL